MHKQFTEKSAPPGGLTARTARYAIVVLGADDRADDFIVLADLVIEDLLLLIRVAIAIA